LLWKHSYAFPNDKPLTPEAVLSKWQQITNFNDGRATHPSSNQEGIQKVTVL
jgi:multifunctional beta-oxidation protein